MNWFWFDKFPHAAKTAIAGGEVLCSFAKLLQLEREALPADCSQASNYVLPNSED
ncbi:MAG TPA: hypothetical protein IGS53_20460 [Leptolyngbyaceae cyanobacterium M33_DOE_097]|nr:hypothetical protein [Leptolyngbyaceae cyanobacterium M33_DOE_097]